MRGNRCGNSFTHHVSYKIITLYTLNMIRICQLYLNKAEKEKKLFWNPKYFSVIQLFNP